MANDVSNFLTALENVELPPEVEEKRQALLNALVGGQEAGNNEDASERNDEENIYNDTVSGEAQEDENIYDDTVSGEAQEEENIYDDTVGSGEADNDEPPQMPPPRPPKVEPELGNEMPGDDNGSQHNDDDNPIHQEEQGDDDPENYEVMPSSSPLKVEEIQDQDYAIAQNGQKESSQENIVVDDETYDIIVPQQPEVTPIPSTTKDEEDDDQVDYTLPVKISDIKDVIKEGWLDKHKKDGQFSLISKFQKRYCVLVKHALYYYKNKKDKCQKGQIILPGYQIIYPPKQVPGTKKVEQCFELSASDKRKFQVIQFMASTKDDAVDWTRNIQRQLDLSISKRKSVKFDRMEIKSVEMDQDSNEAGSEKSSLCDNEDIGSDELPPEPTDELEDLYEAIPGSQQIPVNVTPSVPVPATPTPTIPSRTRKTPQEPVPPLPSDAVKPVDEETGTQEDTYDDVDNKQSNDEEIQDFYDDVDEVKMKAEALALNLPEIQTNSEFQDESVEEQEDFYEDIPGNQQIKSAPSVPPSVPVPATPTPAIPPRLPKTPQVPAPPLPSKPSGESNPVGERSEPEEDTYDDVDSSLKETIQPESENDDFYDDVEAVKMEAKSLAQDQEIQEDFYDDVDAVRTQAMALNETSEDVTIPPTQLGTAVTEQPAPLPPRPPKLGAQRSVPEPEEEKPRQLSQDDDVKPENVYVALWDCSADGEDELDFKRGDFIHVLNKVSTDWWIGKCMNLHHLIGLVPTAYLQEAYY